MKLDATKIVLFLSILLNALGGSGVIAPISGAPAPAPCAPAATSADAGTDAQ
jgi:hypothetical protein